MTAAGQDLVGDLLADDGVRVLFQPVVDLTTRRPVGVEALCRGPAGSALELPDVMFAAARDEALVPELDWASRLEALRAALDAGARPPMTLFVNAEPEALLRRPPEGFEQLRRQVARAGVQVVLEVTEHDLADDPGSLLAALSVVRGWGWALAVDDVGARPASLALLPLLAPEVVKLDLRLVQQHPSVEVAEIVDAVLAHAGRTGALVLAEGIETPEHEQLALAMGATLGQGWLYGHAGPLARAGWSRLRLPSLSGPPRGHTPWSLVRGSLPTRRATKPLLAALSLALERQALAQGSSSFVVAAFQDAGHFTPETAERYTALGWVVPLVLVLGAGMPPQPAPGVRGSALAPDDPLRDEWVLVVLGPHVAAALVAHDLGDPGPQAERRFDYALVHDRSTVLAVAAALLPSVVRLP
ncbi:MAG: sensor domain-containing phosphodiesterase [Mycobacteriales bacterium]